jgi:hypothetical protein
MLTNKNSNLLTIKRCSMKEEGFVNGAYNIIKEKNLTARWQANQSSFDGFDSDPISPIAKASVIVALSIYNSELLINQLDTFIENVDKATTKGEIKKIINDVDALLKR